MSIYRYADDDKAENKEAADLKESPAGAQLDKLNQPKEKTSGTFDSAESASDVGSQNPSSFRTSQ